MRGRLTVPIAIALIAVVAFGVAFVVGRGGRETPDPVRAKTPAARQSAPAAFRIVASAPAIPAGPAAAAVPGLRPKPTPKVVVDHGGGNSTGGNSTGGDSTGGNSTGGDPNVGGTVHKPPKPIDPDPQ
jgi:hypothetical protein